MSVRLFYNTNLIVYLFDAVVSSKYILEINGRFEISIYFKK